MKIESMEVQTTDGRTVTLNGNNMCHEEVVVCPGCKAVVFHLEFPEGGVKTVVVLRGEVPPFGDAPLLASRVRVEALTREGGKAYVQIGAEAVFNG